MAIVKFTKPTISITGTEITTNGVSGTTTSAVASAISTLEKIDATEKVSDGTTTTIGVSKGNVRMFSGDVSVTIAVTADSYTDEQGVSSTPTEMTYTTASFKGEKPSSTNGGSVNNAAVIYYSLNGKIVKRTKSNLYTGAITLKGNKSGADNVILRARVYYKGKWSQEEVAEFRIIRSNNNITG
jgi:hypothetical protein